MKEQKLEEAVKKVTDAGEHNGFSQFNDIEYAALRAYNRCVMMSNIQDTHGEEASLSYAHSIDGAGQNEMWAMFQYIYTKGVAVVNKEVKKGEINLFNEEQAAMKEKENAVVN